ncbi:MAG TPA: HAMP domain-containing histidine kinase [Nitratifractor sp.]|nr:HAMP domain-containing histidine kinase [Nitratifractor sp.]
MKELIEQQMSYFSLLASKKRLTLSCKLDSTAIQIDKDDFKRLFSNLLSNSIKYNKKGGSIKITLKSGTLTITDSGIGIEQKEIKNIFKRYYRATDESGGFGLGLSIVQEICKRYNIDLKVQSKPGVRTIFRLDFHTY